MSILRSTRRGFLKLGANTLASAGLLGTLGGLQRAFAGTETSGYRALVCIFLEGGNDSFNMLVPGSEAEYSIYAASRRNLAVPRDQLLSLSSMPGAEGCGLHPACTSLQALADEGRLGLVANVGTLVAPVTRDQVRSRTAPLPPYLFSHSDQRRLWMGAPAGTAAGHGWAGRVADLLQAQGFDQSLAVNLSIDGLNAWQAGETTAPYVLRTDGAVPLFSATDASLGVSGRRSRFLELLQQAGDDQNLLLQELAAAQTRAIETSEFVSAALAQTPTPAQPFPDTAVGRQLHMAARMIAARGRLGVSRQLIYVRMGGWDMHDGLLQRHPKLLADLGDSLKAFSDAMIALGVDGDVTAFTASEFGRTLTSNGDGSDHGWGGHQLVVGGAVRCGVHGRLPTLAVNGPDDAGNGRIIPTTAFDQYMATLARWFGLPDAELDAVFPHLRNFAARDLGFLA